MGQVRRVLLDGLAEGCRRTERVAGEQACRPECIQVGSGLAVRSRIDAADDGEGSQVDQHRAAAEPAESCALRQLALEYGRSIDARAGERERRARLLLEPAEQRQQSALDDFVVVPANRSLFNGHASWLSPDTAREWLDALDLGAVESEPEE